MTFAERLKATRKQRGVSKNQLAGLAKVGRGHLNQIEEGRIKNPTVEVAQRLAGALGVPLADLLGIVLPASGPLDQQLASIPAPLAAAIHEARGSLPEARYDQLIATVLNVIALSMAGNTRPEPVTELVLA